MKRLDFRDGAYVSVYDKLGFLPSTREKAFESIIDNTCICSVKDLCLTKREKLLFLPNVSKAFVDGIETYLNQHGLRLGMTMKELYDYMDEAYLEEMASKNSKTEEVVPDSPDVTNVQKAVGESETKAEDKKDGIGFEAAVFFCSFLGAFTAITLDIVLDCIFRMLF